MSFLKKIEIKSKALLLKEFFYDYFWKKSSLNLGLASLIFSFAIIQFSTPQFYISATLRENQAGGSYSSSPGGASEGLLSIVSSESSSYDEFRSNIYSYIIAQRMWEKGWATEIYAGGDKSIDANEIEKPHTLADHLGALFLGYELYDFYSPHDLQAFISSKVDLRKEIRGTNITVSMLTSDQNFGLSFLNELMLDADKYAKEFLILKSQAIIDGTYKQLPESRNSAITASLAATINRESLQIATLKNDLPYHIYFIDPPYSSEYPVTPNTLAIFISNFIIFIFLSVMYNFIRNHKEDLW